MRRRRAAATRGSSVPTTSKSSTRRSRTARLPSASSFGNSVSRRSNASSTCPPERSRSATSSCADRSSGAEAAAFRISSSVLPCRRPQQVRLREARRRRGSRAGPARSRCGRRMPRPRSRRARSRRTPPGAAAAAAPRRARPAPASRLAVGGDAARDAVLGAELEELVEHLLDHVVGLHAREERDRLAGDDGDDRRDRLRLERLHQLRAAVGIGGGEHEPSVASAHESLERRDERGGLLAPGRPQHDDDRDGARELERASRTPRHPSRRRCGRRRPARPPAAADPAWRCTSAERSTAPRRPLAGVGSVTVPPMLRSGSRTSRGDGSARPSPRSARRTATARR